MKNKIKEFFKNDERMTKVTAIVVILLFLCTICINVIAGTSKNVTDSLASKIIRFHVVANSDSTQDQLLKQQIKDRVIAYIEPLLEDSTSIEETRYILKECLPLIEEVAKEVIAEWEKDYDVYVVLDQANFPTKSYGDVVLPAGEYESCRIIIGEGKGENWWCVMFPPLCYLDASTGVVPLEGKEQLAKELNEEQYDLIMHREKPYQIRFKLIDGINSFFCEPNYKQVN